ncbi:glycoside hydrolase family protein, partial [Flavobacterium aurantiibacter]
KFKISTPNVPTGKATLYVEEVQATNETAIKASIQLKSNQENVVEVKYTQGTTFDLFLWQDDLLFRATLSCDGLSAKTGEFKLKYVMDRNNEPLLLQRKDISEFRPSLNLYQFLKEIESLERPVYNNSGEVIKIYPYPSIEGGSPTIGWGHKIKKGENFDSGISLGEAEQLLIEDVQTEGITKLLNFNGDKKITVKLTQYEFDALVSAVYNNGYGETLAEAINRGHGYYLKNPESIYKGFLTRIYVTNPRTKKKEISNGLIKRQARQADIFIKNQWHSYGKTDPKYKSEIDYVNAFKKFLKSGVLPFIILFLSYSLISCYNKNPTNMDSNVVSQPLNDQHYELALSRIYKFDDGLGNNKVLLENYRKEKQSWQFEIEKAYLKLHEKVKNESKDEADSLEAYHAEWKEYLKSKRAFATNYINDFHRSGINIFQIMVYYRTEYQSKLAEYYMLLEVGN